MRDAEPRAAERGAAARPAAHRDSNWWAWLWASRRTRASYRLDSVPTGRRCPSTITFLPAGGTWSTPRIWRWSLGWERGKAKAAPPADSDLPVRVENQKPF